MSISKFPISGTAEASTDGKPVNYNVEGSADYQVGNTETASAFTAVSVTDLLATATPVGGGNVATIKSANTIHADIDKSGNFVAAGKFTYSDTKNTDEPFFAEVVGEIDDNGVMKSIVLTADSGTISDAVGPLLGIPW